MNSARKTSGMRRRGGRNSGQAMLIAIFFLLFLSAAVVLGIASPILKHAKTSLELQVSKQSQITSESALEEVFYRIIKGKTVSPSESLTVNGTSATTTVTSTANGKRLITTASINGRVRKMRADISLGTGISFHYGIQAGEGGFYLSNSSSITGNAFSDGPIVGENDNMIYGDVISAQATGKIYGIHATGTAYAHAVGKSGYTTEIDKDAYYQTITGTVVHGTQHPGSPDQTSVALPISDEQIAEWESEAEAGGILSSSFCDSYSASSNTCTISTSKSLGPKKIPFNLLVKSSSGVLTVTGPIWVTGDITFQTGPTVRVSPSLGSTNVAFIADNPADQAGSGVITVGQSTLFEGSGSTGSFVFMISQNNSAETGGTNDAISLNQGASDLVAYAAHGQISLGQSVSVKEATGYKIMLKQSANVIYDTGLPNTLFSAGPSGGYEVLDWYEVP